MERSSLFSDEESAVSTGESGWTMYFEDFMSSKKVEENKEDESSNGCGMKPFISDAASSSAWKYAAMAETGDARKNLSFMKRRRTRGVLDDDSLEDTATSPMNSPKVISDVLKFNQMKKTENEDSPLQDKGGNFQKFREHRRPDEMGEMGLFQNGNECSEIKKRGLCLFPMSMLADYLE